MGYFIHNVNQNHLFIHSNIRITMVKQKQSGGARPGAGRKKCANCLPCKIISFKVSLEKETEAKEEIKLIIQKKYSHVENIKPNTGAN